MISLVTFEADEFIADRALEWDFVWVASDRHARTLLLGADASQVVHVASTIIQHQLISFLALFEFFEDLSVVLENQL